MINAPYDIDSDIYYAFGAVSWTIDLDKMWNGWHISFKIYDPYEYFQVREVFNDTMYWAQELGTVFPFDYTVHIEDYVMLCSDGITPLFID